MQEDNKDPNTEELVARYERCQSEGRPCYFDVDELEDITDFYLKKGRNKDSTQVVELGLKLHPNSSILLLKKAVLYLEIGEAKRALRILDRLPEKDDTEANLVRSEVLLQLSRRDEAVLLLHQVMEEETFERSDLALDISGILIQSGEYGEAADFIREALLIDPSNLDLLFEMAYNYEQLNQTTEAIRIYNQILAIDPYSSETWFNLGQACFNEKSYGSAVDAYDYALVINPADSLAMLQKAHALFQNEQYLEAAEVYQEYGELTEFSPIVLVYIGECLEKTDQFDKAMEYYRKSFEKDPQNVDALTGMGICLMEKEQFRDSLVWFERALRVDRYISETWVYVAEVFVNLEMPEEAMLSYLRALEIDPLQADVQAAIGNLHFDAGTYDQALKYYNEAEHLEPDLPGLDLFYALVYAKTGDRERSASHLAAAVEKDPNAQSIYDDLMSEKA
ncbi:MAG: tetratricopeptide repeat protein, partial [Bacteroidia bacterium]|nr:tetratricopeptide repeat protein [Bacteroidia bacterium]